MENRFVGYMLVLISLLIGFIIYSFNSALTKIVNESCTHGPTCPMWGTIDFQTNISLGIMAIVALVGLYLIFFRDRKKESEIKPKTSLSKNRTEEIKEMQKKEYTPPSDLAPEEKHILDLVIESNGAIFQSDIVEKTGYGKVKVTRILDKLEGKGLIERRRRGMTNMIILKRA